MVDQVHHFLVYSRDSPVANSFWCLKNRKVFTSRWGNNFLYTSSLSPSLCDILTLEKKSLNFEPCSVSVEFLLDLVLASTDPQDAVIIWNPSCTICFRMVQACLVLGHDAVVWTADQADYDISEDLEFNKAEWLKA